MAGKKEKYDRDPAKLLKVYWILKRYSSKDHPLTQQDIIDLLYKDYGTEAERKSIARNLTTIDCAGCEIEYLKQGGCYLVDRDFTDEQLRLLIDSVLSSKHISAKQSKDLLERLVDQSTVHFKSHVKHIATFDQWNKTESENLFYNIELIDSAIEQKLQVGYDYNKYGIDGKLHKSSYQYISPYQLILHNQRYYLMGYSDYWKNMVYHRLDHITNLSLTDKKAVPVRDVKGYAAGIDYKRFNAQMPYMYSDDPVYIDFVACSEIIDQVVDWFGKEAKITQIKDDPSKVKVMVRCSPMAMKHWALQYLDYVEVASPENLRKEIAQSLECARKKYSK